MVHRPCLGFINYLECIRGQVLRQSHCHTDLHQCWMYVAETVCDQHSGPFGWFDNTFIFAYLSTVMGISEVIISIQAT